MVGFPDRSPSSMRQGQVRSGEAVALVKHCGLGGFPAAHSRRSSSSTTSGHSARAANAERVPRAARNGAQPLSGQIVVLRRLCAKRSPHRLAPQDWDAKRPSTKGRANAQIVRPQPPSEAKPARADWRICACDDFAAESTTCSATAACAFTL